MASWDHLNRQLPDRGSNLGLLISRKGVLTAARIANSNNPYWWSSPESQSVYPTPILVDSLAPNY